MSPYICVTYARGDEAALLRLSDLLTGYGFRCRCIHETTDASTRSKTLSGAAIVIALTSPEAERVGTVAADLRRLPDRAHRPIGISLAPNALNDRFCAPNRDGRSMAPLITFSAETASDAHTVSMLMHRLFVEQLCRIEGAVTVSRCRRDVYGRVVLLAERAYAGDAAAAYALGCAYERGEGLPIFEEEAIRWIVRASDQGYPTARLHMGELCLLGESMERDADRAHALFSSVAAEGDARGEYRLGLCALNGVGMVRDPVRAMAHLRRAAETGYAPALYRVGLLFRDGIGTDTNPYMAMQCFFEACRRGVAMAAFENDGSVESAEIIIPMADLNAQISQNASVLPAAPRLFALWTQQSPRCVSMRQLRRHRLGRLLRAKAYAQNEKWLAEKRHAHHLSEGHIRSEREIEAGILHSFMGRSQVTDRLHPETDWPVSIAELAARQARHGRAKGHQAIYIERGEAMGMPFEVAEAALALACLLENGAPEHGLSPHPTRALVWYRYALRCGSNEAMYRLAEAYRRGIGVPTDAVGAVELYRVSAEHGDVRSMFALAVCCERGIGRVSDMAEAVRLYEQAAAAGYAPAQNNLGGCYEHGMGVPTDRAVAIEWYTRAAEADLPEAICRLASCYERGMGTPFDPKRASSLYERAVSLGNAYAAYRLGVWRQLGTGRRHATCGDFAESIRLWETADSAGIADAAYALSVCYAQGPGVRPDSAIAMTYLRRAAAGDDIRALCRLGFCLLEGKGIIADSEAAVHCFTRVVALWRERRAIYLRDTAPRPIGAYALTEAAGDAYYMLGYCVLEGVGGAAEGLLKEDVCRRAATYFEDAATLGHVGALTALGDLYAYGLLPVPASASDVATTSDAETETVAERLSRAYYERAAHVSALRREVPSPIRHVDWPEPSADTVLPIRHQSDTRHDNVLSTAGDTLGLCSIPALMSLAIREIRRHADTVNDGGGMSDGMETGASMRRIWRYFAACVEQGSVDARIGMAECLYFGYGIPQNRPAARRMLEQAERFGGRVTASLWLGDLLWIDRDGHPDPTEADCAYLRACDAKATGSEVGPYVVSARRQERLAYDEQARTAVFYRLAAYRAVCFSSDPIRGETFPYLVEALYRGHRQAREDLARMYTYEREYAALTAAAVLPATAGRFRRLFRRGAKHRRTEEALPVRSHREWLNNYYASLWPEPAPFAFSLHLRIDGAQLPAYIARDVTPNMEVDMFHYIGECLLHGDGVTRDAAAAVFCYREAVQVPLSIPYGQPAPASLLGAQYRLGRCLLYGEGTERRPSEAVKWLIPAARSHAEACYTLGECYENGFGVQVADAREALKYYRKALRMGCPRAEDKVGTIEQQLGDKAAEDA